MKDPFADYAPTSFRGDVLDLASRDLGNLDGAGLRVGGAALAFRTFGHRIY